MKRGIWIVILLLVACRPQPDPVILPSACPDPLAGCRLDAGVVLRFSVRPSIMQPFDLEVEAPEDAAVHASFRMSGMDMGPNRYRLLRENDRWRARVLLPACVQGRRDWILRLEVGNKIYEIPFMSG